MDTIIRIIDYLKEKGSSTMTELFQLKKDNCMHGACLINKTIWLMLSARLIRICQVKRARIIRLRNDWEKKLKRQFIVGR